jgi:uncharacterized membrane protein YhdT
MNETSSASDRTLAMIENEKRRDRFVRRVNIAAWAFALTVVLLIGVLVAVQAAHNWRAAAVGALPWSAVTGAVMPLVDVLWKLSLLVAALSTIAVFLRLRTASLTEIQLRLATLEELFARGADERTEP